MKLPPDAYIAPEKLTRYLLVRRKRNDKSQWLAQAGYTVENWQVLEIDLRRQILALEAIPTDLTRYGQIYEIAGTMVGPNQHSLAVQTIWMTETATGLTKFITMYPDKREA
jgi:hypothetical protein